MVVQYLIYVPTLIALLILACFVGYSNSKARSNRSFVVFVFAIACWVAASFLADIRIIGDATTAVRLIYGVAALLPLTLIYFIQNFLSEGTNLVSRNFVLRNINKFVAILAIFFTIVSFSNLTVQLAVSGQYGAQVKHAGPLLWLHVAYYLLVSVYALAVVLIAYRRTTSVEKNNALLLLIGLSLIVIVNIVVNGVLIILGNSNLGPLIGVPSILVFVGMVSAGIVKHGLFDVRLLVARAVGYISSLSILVSLYLLVVFGVSQIFSLGPEAASTQRIFSLFTALLFAVTLPPLKKLFDRLTNRLFFRDAYDSQSVLDQVSSVIVGNVNPHKVQSGALNALSNAIKPTYMTFLLVSQIGQLRQGDSTGLKWSMSNPEALQNLLKGIGKSIISYDELDEKKTKIKEFFKVENIRMVAPLVTKDEAVGYLIVGPRKSGNIYNSQDLGLLNIATNELAVALQNAQRFEEIQAFNITLQEKITEATRELKQTNKKLVALDEAKDEFISMASHQLRTPLTSIKGYLSMLSDGDMGKMNAQQVKAVQEAFASSQRMVFLIADFLNVSRIKTGKFVIERSKVDLATVVTEELTQLRELFEAKDLKLSYEPPYDLPTFMLDDNKMRQVMMNMIDNAIYYTPAGGSVTVQLYKTAEELIFKVVDTGIGVAKAEQHKLFTKFFRASNARKARPDGTGLGLFMAQKIIVEQGGAVIFESTEGKGSTFGFRFPLAKIKA